MNRPLLDTHAWVWWICGDSRLTAHERETLDNLPPTARPVLSEISLWEVAMLVDLGRLELDMDLERWLAVASAPATVELARITPAVAAEVARLPEMFHRDPADRLIVATARVMKLRVLTRDQKITKARVVPLWRAS
ncbi:MAG: type II toxin-antitoxin system VapC family toxin [Verrucomicrobiota bacterium]